MTRYTRLLMVSILVLSSLVATGAEAHEDQVHFGSESQEEFNRIGQILLRCGGKEVAGKSDFIENVVKTASYSLTDDLDDHCDDPLACSSGGSTWFDEDRFKELSYRERALKMVNERLLHKPVFGTVSTANELMSLFRIALPLLSDQYFGKATAPTQEDLAAISKIPELLIALGLASGNHEEMREICVKHFQGPETDGYAAPKEEQMPLKDKLKIFDQRAKDSFKTAGDHLVGSTGDTLLWTGIYIASQAHRFRMTHEEEAIANMEPSLWAFHDLHKVTGSKTLVARRMQPEPDRTKALPNENFHGAKGYEDFKWRGHVSWDMYLGYLYGIGESWDVIQDPKLKDALREDLREIALGYIEDGMAIDAFDTYLSSDPDGCFTDHRKCSIFEKLAKNLLHHFVVKAGNAVRALNLLQVAGYVTEDPRILKAYQDLMDHAWWRYARDYGLKRTEDLLEGVIPVFTPLIKLFIGSDVTATVESLRDPVGMNLGHLTGYMLVRFEKDPKIRQYYLEGFEKQTHEPVQFDDNTFFDFLLGIYTHPAQSTVDDWVDTFRHFPLDDYTHRTNSTNPEIDKYKGLDAKGHANWHAYEPLPLEIRPMHGFAWQANSYKLDGGSEDACPGVPFLAAYWLGRYAGFISAAE